MVTTNPQVVLLPVICIIARHLVMWTCNCNEVKQVQIRLQEVEYTVRTWLTQVNDSLRGGGP
jgi:hypothetical protein